MQLLKHPRPVLLGALAVLLLFAGCGPKGEPPLNAPPPSPPGGGTDGSAGVSQSTAIAIRSLETAHSTEFEVPLEKRSPAVAEHYDRELAAKGWQKRAPKAGQPGQRQWIAIAVQAGGGAATSGPTDAYDAAWEDPKTGRVAVLNLWHAAKDPSVQHGTFDIYEKGQAPF